MDIEKMIERLREKGCEDCPHRDTCRDDDTAECVIRLNAATALSTLQAENDKLRAELENYRKSHCSEGGCAAEKDRDLIIAENEQWRAAPEQVQQDRLGWLSPICIGCPGKTEDGKRTELCGEPDDLERCVEQSKRLAELARAALRREQDGNRI